MISCYHRHKDHKKDKFEYIQDYTFNSTKDMNLLIKDINSISFETKKELFIIYSNLPFGTKNIITSTVRFLLSYLSIWIDSKLVCMVSS